MESEANQLPQKSGRLVPALLVINSLLLAGVLAMLVLPSDGKSDDEAAPAAADEKVQTQEALPLPGTVGPIVRLPDFVIHLRNPEVDRYLRLVIELELGKDTDRETIASHMAPIRDAFIGHLSDRTLEEMRGSDGMERLRKDLHKILGDIVSRPTVRTVYITEFMVQ